MKQLNIMYQIILLSQVTLEKLEDLEDNNLFKKNNKELFDKFYEVITDLAENSTDKLTDKQIQSFQYNTDRMRKLVDKINIKSIL
ncbi:hypothetical protein UFOVP603_36 [uncultured Caudovirales phage]|jgi:hypothetical protein|uniref:Uncharacterized protein n=1 Tax=uncultured Caudovirales phage TaxID=2100421 RepID=A0A6J5N3L1_9CAUD|nr:hypothetical protein UFOVP603_36 [uncultured Caudovirales phage]